MIYPQCGLEAAEQAKYCPRCGAPMASRQHTQEIPPQAISEPPNTPPVSDSPAGEPLPGKKKSRAALGFAVLSLILAVILVLQNLGIIGLIPGPADGSPGQERMEGKGYGSAEKAVEAYVKALKQGDVPAMLSTFATETYIDSYDTKAGLISMRAWIPSVLSEGTYELVGSDYERQLRYRSRQASVSQRLYSQLLTYPAFLGNGPDSFDPQAPITFDGEEDVREFLRIYRESPFGDALAEMELEEFVDPNILSEAYASEAHQKNMGERAKILGCDEYKSVAARVTLGGESWLLTMDCASYGGRWYNLTPASILANMLGATPYQCGLLPWSAVDNPTIASAGSAWPRF